MSTKIYFQEFHEYTSEQVDVIDISEQVRSHVLKSNLRDGQALVYVAGSTASITTLEFEPGVVSDLKRAIEQIAPREIEYAHNARWGDGNGYAHVSAALLGPSCAFPVSHGEVVLGTWQQIVLVDFDNKPRHRVVIIQITGR